MGGRIGVESRPGAGSTFWVDLARADPPAAAEAPEERAATVALATPPDKPQRVLYIEDNLENLRLVESLLKRWKEVTLIPAMQGQVGLDLAADQADLIVLDVHLPDLTGEEVLRQLKANPSTRGIPVIVASADTTPEQATRMMDAGALHYFTKPLDVRQFLATLSQILGGAAGPPATL
jgi:CheY-like chemotaxis protein